jgi:hypothetical protein
MAKRRPQPVVLPKVEEFALPPLTPKHKLPEGHTPQRPTKVMRDKRKRREENKLRRELKRG